MAPMLCIFVGNSTQQVATEVVSMNGSVPDRGPVVFAVTTATLVLASILVGARIICRYFVVRNVTWDDK
ncbi:Major facilitator superfamily domain, general substrate transporter [Purpureocillium lavendulum]|uniref:Major facilitator superfamily domain, general substrate transporter n=1 Tax=Purpureocillium lavendulum TaxID=1247861 RepID=A0AB34FHQ3_9HYPO|nr:Major facilitator superfamily domain, general substrate transporter [Purpureocillium lavendulum]